jgi:pimeloyl-ACP methyl ester carboxylesterase
VVEFRVHSINPRAQRPGFSETFPYPLRYTPGADPIAFFDAGPTSARGDEGPEPILLIHGLGGNFTHWEHVAPSLARTRRVIGLDLPGCGDSFKRPRYSVRMYAEACARLLDELGIARAVWVGHSLGGMVACEGALDRPSRVSSLALVDSAGFQRFPMALRIATRAVAVPWIVAPAMERYARKLLDNVFWEANERTRRFIGQAEGRAAHPTIDEFADMACSIVRDLLGKHYLDRVERVVQPTLVIWGDRDKLCPVDDVARWTRRIARARLVVLRECGHMPIIERPEAVVEALAAFLDEDSGGARERRALP